jgi:hypothetical protein
LFIFQQAPQTPVNKKSSPQREESKIPQLFYKQTHQTLTFCKKINNYENLTLKSNFCVFNLQITSKLEKVL